MASKFPVRTLVLMTLTLFAFIWFWWQTHLPKPEQTPHHPPMRVIQWISLDQDAGP